jgi:UDP-N-acetylglucosamine 2-epimerase (non-hydrolysing)
LLPMMKIKVLSVFGTRPEALKMAPVIQKLRAESLKLQGIVCVTAQHREMLDQVLNLFDITADYDLDLMTSDQSPSHVASRIFEKMDPLIAKEKPEWVLIQGDTTTVMATSLVAHHNRVKVGHIEAGLRSGDKYQPFPEEINRRVVGVAADLHFAPTERARENLLKENVPDDHIVVTGNTIIDTLRWMTKQPFDLDKSPLKNIPWEKRIILVTAHRRENFGEPIREICDAVKTIAHSSQNVHLVYPVHLNTHIHGPVYELLGNVDNITLLPPLDYQTLIYLIGRSYFALTDSGGIREDAPSFGKPVLVLRNKTERPEGIEVGIAKLVGTDRQCIVEETEKLLNDDDTYKSMARFVNPYGDGHAAERIVQALLNS